MFSSFCLRILSIDFDFPFLENSVILLTEYCNLLQIVLVRMAKTKIVMSLAQHAELVCLYNANGNRINCWILYRTLCEFGCYWCGFRCSVVHIHFKVPVVLEFLHHDFLKEEFDLKCVLPPRNHLQKLCLIYYCRKIGIS